MIRLPDGTEVFADAEELEVLPGLVYVWVGGALGWLERVLQEATAEDAMSESGKRISVTCVPRGTLDQRRKALAMAKQCIEEALAEMDESEVLDAEADDPQV